MHRILMLEDDFKLAQEVRIFLEKAGFSFDVVYDGLLFFRQPALDEYGLFILDVNVPSVNGFEVCKRIRERGLSIPVLMLTAYDSIDDKVTALDWGADDYLVKPFHPEELLARIRALLRRHGSIQEEGMVYIVGDLEIHTTDSVVVRNGLELRLTPKEYKILELLASYKGKVVSKKLIAEKVWDFGTSDNTIEVYINFLRNKIDKGFDQPLLHTRTGYGYYLKAE